MEYQQSRSTSRRGPYGLSPSAGLAIKGNGMIRSLHGTLTDKDPTLASLNFEKEKHAFRKFYDSSWKLFENARKAYIRIISSLLRGADVGEVTKIEGRVKDKEECIKNTSRMPIIPSRCRSGP
jgi:hypothetical protein